DDPVERIAGQASKSGGSYGDLRGYRNFPETQGGYALPPFAEIRRPGDALPPQLQAELVIGNGGDRYFICREGGVADAPCRLSEPWLILGQPYDGMRIEQEGHRTVR